MKLNDFVKLLEAVGNFLQATGGTGHIGDLNALVQSLKASKFKTSNDVFKFAAGQPLYGTAGDKMGYFLPILESLSAIVALAGKKAISDDLKQHITDLKKISELRISDLLKAIAEYSTQPVRSSRQAKAAGAREVEGHPDIEAYFQRLEKALGHDVAFKAVYEEIKNDKRMKKPSLLELANKFMGPIGSKATKDQALDRIWYRHKSLQQFKTET